MRTDPNKPKYKVPSMEEIAAISKNGLTVVSTFSGAGGSCLGYEMAGFTVLWANEFVPNAQACHRANFPDTRLDCRDIRKVRPEEILEAIRMKAGEIDILDGSPPCQAFSTAGKRQKGWGKERAYEHGAMQCNETLFDEYIRILRGLMPRAFVAENVSGLVKGVAKGFFLDILAGLKASGYRVKCKVLDAQWLGVPQMRQRAIFVGIRNDLNLEPPFPRPLPYRYSVRDAIPWIDGRIAVGNDAFEPKFGEPDGPSPTIMSEGARTSGLIERRAILRMGAHEFFPGSDRNLDNEPAPSVAATGFGSYKSEVRITGRLGTRYKRKLIPMSAPAPAIMASGANQTRFQIEKESDISHYTIGAEAGKLKAGQQSKRYFSLVRAPLDGACPTVTGSGGGSGIASVIHLVEKRKFTIAELKRICAFPDDFMLVGSYADQWARLGNAVPPIMMRAIARELATTLLPLKS